MCGCLNSFYPAKDTANLGRPHRFPFCVSVFRASLLQLHILCSQSHGTRTNQHIRHHPLQPPRASSASTSHSVFVDAYKAGHLFCDPSLPAAFLTFGKTDVRRIHILDTCNASFDGCSYVCVCIYIYIYLHMAVGQNQWYPISGKVNSPPILEPILVV